MRIIYLICAILFYFCFYNVYVQSCSDFPKAAKHVPRIGRGKQSDPRNDAFEKFFLKASKSVPRIGRREPAMIYYGDNTGKYVDNSYKRPLWADVSDKFENEPEIFANPQLFQEYETALGDDPLVYDISNKIRYKRTNIPSYKHKELLEYHLQPDQDE